MLKNNELRIGNLVSQNSSYGYVYSIESPLPRKEKRFSDKVVITLFDNGIISIPIDEITPIQLTEEWLLKFRFDKDDFCSLYIRYTLNNITIIHDTKNNTFLVDGIKYKLVYLKYVHQLQNLYFCLCGKELELSNQNVM